MLSALLLSNKLGVQVLAEDAAREISQIWNVFAPGVHSERSIISALEKFIPIDRTLDPNASVRIAFERARIVLQDK